MANQYKTLFVLLSISYLFSIELAFATVTTAKTSKKALNFIKLSCKRTKYSDVCVHSLSTYANTIQTNPQRLLKTALAVTLKHAKSTKLLVSHLRSSQLQPLQDCAPSEAYDSINDCLNDVVRELENSGIGIDHSQSLSHLCNAQASITLCADDTGVENTCSSRFSAKTNSIKSRLVSLRKETSNAVSLFNAFAKK